jgi:hypothetical protein
MSPGLFIYEDDIIESKSPAQRNSLWLFCVFFGFL